MIFDDLLGIFGRVYLEIIKLCSKPHQDLPGLTGGHAHLRWAPLVRLRFYLDFMEFIWDLVGFLILGLGDRLGDHDRA